MENKLFAVVYDDFMATLEKKVLGKRRAQLLSDLEGDVLEVGAGTGINFQYYNKKAKVWAIEPDKAMLEKAKDRIPDGVEINLVQSGVEDLQNHLKGKQFDYVVCTLVLCTIPDLEANLKAMFKILKPSGKLLVIEHVHSKNNLIFQFQKIVNPAWNFLAAGCNLTRNTDEIIEKIGFKKLENHYFNMGLQGYFAIYEK